MFLFCPIWVLGVCGGGVSQGIGTHTTHAFFHLGQLKNLIFETFFDIVTTQAHGGRLPVRPDTNPPPPPLAPQPTLVSTWLELAIWALVAPGIFFEPGKFAKQKAIKFAKLIFFWIFRPCTMIKYST